MKDFIGQQIEVGSWLAAGGAGNSRAEYGMVLHRVEAVAGGKLKMHRLRVTYPKHTEASAEAKVSVVRSQKGTKFVVVVPPEGVVALFERIVAGTGSRTDHRVVGKWLHGQTENLL